MFVPAAVENKLRMVEEGRHRQLSDVQHIIDQRDWPKLAATLVHDDNLALELAEQNTIIAGLFNHDRKVAVLRVRSVERSASCHNRVEKDGNSRYPAVNENACFVSILVKIQWS